MEIRQATYSDLDTLMKVFEGAKKIMRSCGNLHQWNEGYFTVLFPAATHPRNPVPSSTTW